MLNKATKNRFEDGTFIPCSYTYRGYTIERMPLITDGYTPTGDFNITCPDGEWCDAYPELSYCKHMVDKWIKRNECESTPLEKLQKEIESIRSCASRQQSYGSSEKRLQKLQMNQERLREIRLEISQIKKGK